MEIPGSGSGSGGAGGGVTLEVVEFSMLLLLVGRTARGGEEPLSATSNPSTHKPNSEPNPSVPELGDRASRSP